MVEVDNRRLIEVGFPLREVSGESQREKHMHRGHISSLHIWWARRPLAASRATTYAALVPAPENADKLRRKLEFTAELSRWENSLDYDLIEQARKEIKGFSGGSAPKVLDCFAGGGSIPLEALRLGCETHALEYNPVAVLILKAALEYPQKYGEKLIEDVKKWSQWVYDEAKKEIGRYYPDEIVQTQRTLTGDGGKKHIPVGYIWARTIRCQNPSCRAEIPLMRQLWLDMRKNEKTALKMLVDKEAKRIDFKIVRGKEIDFDPSQGTTRMATVHCPVCGSVINSKSVREAARRGQMGQRLVAVILYDPSKRGKIYRVASDEDKRVYDDATNYLGEKIKSWRWNYNPVPDERIDPKSRNPRALWLYGMDSWGDAFNPRQRLAMVTFQEKIRLAHEEMIKQNYDTQYARSIVTYLALALDKLADYNSTLSTWKSNTNSIRNTFAMQAFPIAWAYHEANPFSHATGSWNNAVNSIQRALEHLYESSPNPAEVIKGTATRLPYPEGFFDAVVTDPPYYDNVQFAELSDFFYVWLKRTIGDLYPELFSTPVTLKSQEVVQNPLRHGGREKAKRFFEDMLTQSFKEIHRVLKPEGIAVILFTHKSTEAWETAINSLLKSGLVLTASWPIKTEMRTRLRAMKTASLASAIYMVCRKRGKEGTAYYNEIQDEIRARVEEKLGQFWEQGVRGADLFASAIGPAVEVFGRYSRVGKPSGGEVSARELLGYVREIVSGFALKMVLESAAHGRIDAETKFYILWRRRYGNARVHLDEAMEFSRSIGVDLTRLWDSGGLVRKEGEFILVLGPRERAEDPAFLKRTKPTTIIDVLHHALILWEKGEIGKAKEILRKTGHSDNEAFWQTAQAISEVLPDGDKERRLLQGFLYDMGEYIRSPRAR